MSRRQPSSPARGRRARQRAGAAPRPATGSGGILGGRRTFLLGLAAAALAYVVLWLLLYDPRPSAAGDNVVYLLLARALAEGRGLVDLHLPGEPPHTRVTMALPALFAPVYALSGGSLAALKATAGLAGLAAVVLAGLWLRPRGERLALAVAATLALSPILVVHAGDTFGEAPFLAASLGALLLFDRSDAGRRPRLLAAALACAVLATWVRLAGVALVAALGLALLRGGRRSPAEAALAVGAAAAAALGPWIGPLVSEAGYARELAARYSAGGPRGVLRILTIKGHVEWLLEHGPVAGLLLPWTVREGALRFVANLFAMAGILTWCVRRLRSAPADPAPAWLLAGASLVLVWTPPIQRLLLPLLPVFLLALLDLARAAGPRPFVVAAAALWLSQAAGAGGAAARAAEVRTQLAAGNEAAGLPGPHAQFRRAALWAGEALPAGSILSARKPQVAFHLAGLEAVPWPATSDPRTFARSLASAGANFLIAGPEGKESWRFLAPFHRAYAARLPLVYETGEPWNTVVLDLTPLRQPGGLEPAERAARWPPPTRFPSRRPASQAATPPARPSQDAR